MRPDYNQMSFTVLTMLLNTTSGTPNQLPLPTWSGPKPSIIRVQSILFSSLASALLAAFMAMLGKQWLNLHVQGSFIDRNRHRELKMRGMIAWRFKFVMECLPFIMQTSLLLLGYALAWYLRDLSHTVSFVITAFTVFGAAFYLFIVFAGTFSKTCPFQTPISVVLRAALEHYREDIVEASKAVRNFFGFTRPQAGLILHRRLIPTPPIASDADDQGGEVRAELSCISTMFKMTKAPDSVTAIMAYIPEIIWDNRLKSVPLLQVYQTLRESLCRSADGKVVPRQGARDRAFWSAKALLHLSAQRLYICSADTTLPTQVKSINHPGLPLGHHGFDRDFNLESTFYIVDWTFGIQPQIPWSELQLSDSHHCWLSHILQYRARDALDKQRELTDDVRGFVAESLSRRSSARVVADCLFIIYMLAGHKPPPRDLLIKDRRSVFFGAILTNADRWRSHQITEVIDGIFDRLDATLGQSAPSRDTSSAIEALSLVVILRDSRICARSYKLFRSIMDLVNNNDTLWIPARLSMQGAYTSSMSNVPQVGDPKAVLAFLRHHISPQQRANVGDQPIHHVFSALALASNEETHRGLAGFDFPDPLFINATIEALENKDFKGLRKSTIFMLSELDGQLFTTDRAFRDQGRAKRFVLAWSAAIHEFLGDPTHRVEKVVVKVLLAIAYLPCLRVHLPKERWNLIQHFPYIMNANPPPLQRCLEGEDIFPFLKGVLDIRSLSPWFGMLWTLYNRLSKGVRKQLEENTQEIASGQGFFHLGSCVSMFDVYLKTLKTQIDALEPLDQAALELRGRLETTEKAKRRLETVISAGRAKSSRP